MASSSCAALHCGARFKGVQTSGRSSYEVAVELKHVDLDNSFVCGYLQIRGLTADYPLLTTYFEADVVGSKHSFVTGKWEADEHVDRQHWGKFPTFAKYRDVFNRPDFIYDFRNQDCIFMRWKEHFLVPDHKIKTIAGASFSGFYYICYQRSTDSIEGFYYHKKSDWFQSLTLKHVPERRTATFTFH